MKLLLSAIFASCLIAPLASAAPCETTPTACNGGSCGEGKAKDKKDDGSVAACDKCDGDKCDKKKKDDGSVAGCDKCDGDKADKKKQEGTVAACDGDCGKKDKEKKQEGSVA